MLHVLGCGDCTMPRVHSRIQQLSQLKCLALEVPQFPRQLPLLGTITSSTAELRDPDPETAALLAASYQAKAAKAKAKSRPRSFDSTRRMKADPRDPRTQTNQWPCFGRHQPAAPEANPHGQWINCSVCNLRLLYTPRKGSLATSTQTVNAPMVTKARHGECSTTRSWWLRTKGTVSERPEDGDVQASCAGVCGKEGHVHGLSSPP